MATVNFLYRSKKDIAFLNIRLLFRQNEKDYVLGAKSKIEVSKYYWEKQHSSTRLKDIGIKNKQSDTLEEIRKIEKCILNAFNETTVDGSDKKWLQNQMDYYYNPRSSDSKKIPETLIEYIEFYIKCRKHEIKPASEKKFNVIKHKMQRMQLHYGKTFFIKDINEDFKRDFVAYYENENYSQNTTHRELVLIKTFCNHAKYNGIETHLQLANLKLKREKISHIHLTFEELEIIDSTKYDFDYLINAKDWLIISCYSGQRISDFMRFTKSMIRVEDGKSLIEFTQRKTGKIMTVPLHKKVLEILDKRNGDFPRKISDQKYNEYIKEVCKLAKINENVIGKKQMNIEEDDEKDSIIRSVTNTYQKHQLVTSHIGRRSFATNFYGIIPTSFLIYVTGHSSEVMFLNYIGKSNKDIAMELTKYF
jgi:integrase